jgi:phospholipase/lecithinase/hemolysin
MQGKRNTLCWHIPGTLTANLDIRFTAAFDFVIKEISAVTSNDSDATLAVGISTDTDSILAATTIGDSQVPVTKTRSDWATTNANGVVNTDEVVVLTVDFDGSSGTAGDDLTIVMTIMEG